MQTSVIESFTCSKTGDEKDNEDGFLISGGYIAVLDGATSKTSARFGDKTGGQFLRDCIIAALSCLEGGESCQTAMDTIRRHIRAEADRFAPEHAAASAIIYSRALRQIWSVGDCQARIGDTLIQKTKLVDRILAETRAFALNALLAQGRSIDSLMEEDTGRELILPLLKLQRQFENRSGPYGYSVFNTDPHDPGGFQAEVYDVPAGSTVVLASDGYPILRETLNQTEKELAEVLAEDPLLCRRFLSTKGVLRGNRSYDDRTYVRFVAE